MAPDRDGMSMAADGATRPATDIDVATLARAIESGTAPFLLDARSRREYDGAHIPGAVNMPFWKLRFVHDRLGVDRDAEIVVYCGHGPRAIWAQRTLSKLGYSHVSLLTGHWQAWQRYGR